MVKRVVRKLKRDWKSVLTFSAYILAGIIIIYLIYLLAGSISSFSEGTNSSTSEGVDTLAKCLTAKGATLYGAYWCPHCQNQKALFGDSVKYLDYVECDQSGENPNPQACAIAGITGYPSWIINGQKYEGEQTFAELKSYSGC